MKTAAHICSETIGYMERIKELDRELREIWIELGNKEQEIVNLQIQREELIDVCKEMIIELNAWIKSHGEDIATKDAILKAEAAISKAESK